MQPASLLCDRFVGSLIFLAEMNELSRWKRRNMDAILMYVGRCAVTFYVIEGKMSRWQLLRKVYLWKCLRIFCFIAAESTSTFWVRQRGLGGQVLYPCVRSLAWERGILPPPSCRVVCTPSKICLSNQLREGVILSHFAPSIILKGSYLKTYLLKVV